MIKRCMYLNVTVPGVLDDLSSSVLAPDRRDQLILIEFLAEAVVRFFILEGRAEGMASSSSPSWTRKLDIESDDGTGWGTMRMLSGNQGVAESLRNENLFAFVFLEECQWKGVCELRVRVEVNGIVYEYCYVLYGGKDEKRMLRVDVGVQRWMNQKGWTYCNEGTRVKIIPRITSYDIGGTPLNHSAQVFYAALPRVDSNFFHHSSDCIQLPRTPHLSHLELVASHSHYKTLFQEYPFI